jgi:hypothetical protein
LTVTNPNVARAQQRTPGGQAALAQHPLVGLIPAYLLDRPKDFFGYELDFLGLAGTTAQTVSVGIQADSDFLLQQIVATGTTTAAPQTGLTFLPFTIQMQDSGSGRQLLSGATHLENLRGTGQQPGILPWPKLLRAASAIAVTLTNLSATQSDVRLCLVGFKVFGQMSQ